MTSIIGDAGLNHATPWSNCQPMYDFKENMTWFCKLQHRTFSDNET